MAVEAAAYHRQQFAAHRNAYGPKIAALLDEGLTTSGVDYADALAHQRAFRQRIAPMFKEVAALIMPATETTAPATLETTGTPLFQAPWSYAGVPVVSIPCGLASDGMPVGLQLVAAAGQEAALLQVAQWCEQRLAFSARPPLWD
jgi:aspartyl-tRNA(Asn)/glutamyl-tRNA(Gln) amidotransferase subunit A